MISFGKELEDKLRSDIVDAMKRGMHQFLENLGFCLTDVFDEFLTNYLNSPDAVRNSSFMFFDKGVPTVSVGIGPHDCDINGVPIFLAEYETEEEIAGIKSLIADLTKALAEAEAKVMAHAATRIEVNKT